MDHSTGPLVRWQRTIVVAAMALTPLLVWTATADGFELPKATFLWLCGLALLALGAVHGAWERRVVVPSGAYAAPVVALVVGLLLAVLVSPLKAVSTVGEYSRYSGLLGYGACLVVFAVAARVTDGRTARALLLAVAGTLAVVATVCLLQAAGLHPIRVNTDGFHAVVGTLGNANFASGWCAIAVPLAAGGALLAWERRVVRWLLAAIVVGGLAALLVTQSAQGPVACVAGLALVAGSAAAGRGLLAERRARIVAAAGTVVVLAAGAFVLRFQIADGLDERRAFWRAALAMFTQAPVAGKGLDTYGQHFLLERTAENAVATGFTQAESAHNVVLQLLASGGLVLTAAYVAFVVVTGIVLVRGLRRAAGDDRLLLATVGAGWLAYQVQSLVSSDLPALVVAHFVLAGAIWCLSTVVPWREVALGGERVRVVGRGRNQRTVVPTATKVAVGLAGAAFLVVGFFALRPLRADYVSSSANRAPTFEAAKADVERSIELAPWQGRYRVVLAQVLERMGNGSAATDAAADAARREPGSSQYALLAARLAARYRPEDESLALRWFKEALRRDPENPAVLDEVSSALLKSAPQRALALARQAVSSKPSDFVGWLAVGRAAERLQRTGDAVAAYDQVVRLAPGTPEAVHAQERLTALR